MNTKNSFEDLDGLNLIYQQTLDNMRKEPEIRGRPPRENNAPADISDKQMKALGRKHLIMMLRDAQAELDQLKGEYEALLTGLHAGITL